MCIWIFLSRRYKLAFCRHVEPLLPPHSSLEVSVSFTHLFSQNTTTSFKVFICTLNSSQANTDKSCLNSLLSQIYILNSSTLSPVVFFLFLLCWERNFRQFLTLTLGPSVMSQFSFWFLVKSWWIFKLVPWNYECQLKPVDVTFDQSGPKIKILPGFILDI